MFIVHDRKSTYIVITDRDPHKEGCKDNLFAKFYANVEIKGLALLESPNIDPWIGMMTRDDSTYFRIFGSSDECTDAGFTAIEGTPVYYETWTKFNAAQESAEPPVASPTQQNTSPRQPHS